MVSATKRSARRGPVGSKTRRSRRRTRRGGGPGDELTPDALISLRTAHMMLESASPASRHALVSLEMARRGLEEGKVADALDSLIRKMKRAVERESYVKTTLAGMVRGVSAKDLVRHRTGQKAK